jgi:hypothetical protein
VRSSQWGADLESIRPSPLIHLAFWSSQAPFYDHFSRKQPQKEVTKHHRRAVSAFLSDFSETKSGKNANFTGKLQFSIAES